MNRLKKRASYNDPTLSNKQKRKNLVSPGKHEESTSIKTPQKRNSKMQVESDKPQVHDEYSNRDRHRNVGIFL